MSEFHDGWLTSNGYKISEKFQQYASSPSVDFEPASEILNENFSFKLIEILWLELALLDALNFWFEPDTINGDQFIAVAKERELPGFEGEGYLIGDEAEGHPLLRLYNPSFAEIPWLEIKYTVDIEKIIELKAKGSLDEELSMIDNNSIWGKFLLSPEQIPLEDIKEDLQHIASEHLAPFYYEAVWVEVEVNKDKVREKLRSQPWLWSELDKDKKWKIINALVSSSEADVDEVGWYIGYLIRLHLLYAEKS